MSRASLLALVLAAGALLPASPTPADLVASLSNHLVAITTGFSGTDVLLFGTTDGKGDVVVVARGPESLQVVRRKGRTLGLWMNEAEVVFGNVPGYYWVAASRPLAEFLPERIAMRHQIGVDQLDLPVLSESASASASEFRAALIRIRQRLDLFGVGVGRVQFLGERLFRTDVRIPANAPVGNYAIGIYVINDGEVAHAEITPLIVNKVGIEARLFDFAQRFALPYGILAVAIAGVAGWLGNLVFRRG